MKLVMLMCFSIDQRSKETTFVHQIFGGYLRSQGRLPFIIWCTISLVKSKLNVVCSTVIIAYVLPQAIFNPVVGCIVNG